MQRGHGTAGGDRHARRHHRRLCQLQRQRRTLLDAVHQRTEQRRHRRHRNRLRCERGSLSRSRRRRGTSYTNPPTVLFSGGAGSGATGYATVVNGAVIGATITAAGTGYTSAPAVSFTTVPSDTSSAMINIAHNPGSNVATLAGFSSATAPFQPTVPSIPNAPQAPITHPQASLSMARATSGPSTTTAAFTRRSELPHPRLRRSVPARWEFDRKSRRS